MSTSESVKLLTGIAGEDFTGDLYKFLKRASGVLAVNDAAQGLVVGVLAEETSKVGDEVPYASIDGGGIFPVLVGAGGVTQDALVASAADGRAIAAGTTAGDLAVGIAMDSGAAGEVVPVLLGRMRTAAGS